MAGPEFSVPFMLTLKMPRKNLEQTTIYMYFVSYFSEEIMLDITCESSAQQTIHMADDSHVMSSIIFSENYVEHALKMSSASRDWRFKVLREKPTKSGSSMTVLKYC